MEKSLTTNVDLVLKILQQREQQKDNKVNVGLDIVHSIFYSKDYSISTMQTDTILVKNRNKGDEQRFVLKRWLWNNYKLPEQTLLMIALLRIMMKDINIAATTALHTINRDNVLKAINFGANVIMPNLTPAFYKENYMLYKNKQSINEGDFDLKELSEQLKTINHKVDGMARGNSIHYKRNADNINKLQ
jgi:hypothetical protein